MRFCRPLRALALLLSLPALAPAWGHETHRLIADIAARLLKPETKERLGKLLDGGETLTSISTWADEVRAQREETATWHYINLPIEMSRGGTARSSWKSYCPPEGCVVSALESALAVLRSGTSDREQQREALKFVVHFAGDIHQPLHSGDRGDRGGNDIMTVYNGRTVSLHRLWDTVMIQEWLGREDARARLNGKPGFWQRRRLSKGDPADWAWEAHDVARNFAYWNLSKDGPVPITREYEAHAGPAITLQIQRAGCRLARLLNDSLGR